MNLKYDFSELWQIVDQLGAEPQSFKFDSKPTVIEQPNSIAGQSVIFNGIEGVEIGNQPGQVHITDTGSFVIDDNPVFIYIYDHSFNFHQVIAGEKEGNRIHIHHCQIIQRMVARRPNQRYIAMSKKAETYLIGAVIDGVDHQGQVPLQICASCVKERKNNPLSN